MSGLSPAKKPVVVEEKKFSAVVVSPASPSSLGKMEISLTVPYSSLGDPSKWKPLGSGGFGEVFQTRWNFNEVAVKVLATKKFTPSALAEFKQEAEIMAKMRSDYIVQLRGLCESPSYCLIMEYMPQGSLYDLLHNGQDIPWHIRMRIGLDVSYGLAQLHEVNILHRDLKSLNILLYEAGGFLRAKLGDFGLSQMKTETQTYSSVAQKASSVGTLPWMAPELISLKPKYSPQSDMYSYGMVLWEIAERKLPFAEADRDELRSEIKAGRAKEEFTAEIERDHPRLVQLMQSCWQLLGQRPSATQAAEIMEALFTEEMRQVELAREAQEKAKTHGAGIVARAPYTISGLGKKMDQLLGGQQIMQDGQELIRAQRDVPSPLAYLSDLDVAASVSLVLASPSVAAPTPQAPVTLLAEECRLAEEIERMELEKLEAEVRQLEAVKWRRELEAKKVQLAEEQRIEDTRIHQEKELAEKRKAEEQARLQKEQEAQRKAKEEQAKREAEERARSEQERARVSWKSHLDPKSGKIYYHNGLTQASVWEAPAGYQAEGAVLRAQQAETQRRVAETVGVLPGKAGPGPGMGVLLAPVFAPTPSGLLLPMPAVKVVEKKMDAKEVAQLLQHVANGEQDEAEALIKKKPELLLCKGNVMDLS